ncbi:MAG: septum formation initiator family protein [Candidatus Binatia bacterium]
MAQRKKKSAKRMEAVVWILGAVVFIQVCTLVFGKLGIRHMFALRTRFERLSGEASTRIARNRELYRRLERLRYDNRALDARARRTLSVVGKDEILYRFTDAEPRTHR